MAKKEVLPIWEEVTFKEEGLDARALVTRTDINGIITFASKAYREMTKYSKNELIGSPHNIVRHPFMPKAAFKEMWDTIKSGKHWKGLVMNLRKDGRHYWVEVSIDAIDNEGSIISSMASVGNDETMSYNCKKISGYLAIRREPARKEIKEIIKYYKNLKKEELNNKIYLDDWEKELLKYL